MKDNAEEILPVVDEKGNVTGKEKRGICHNGSMILHPVVHLHVINELGELYLQKRPAWKDIQPGKWDTSVGGHIGYGEEIKTSLMREVEEELGITKFFPEFVTSYILKNEIEHEYVYVYKTLYTGILIPSKELSGGAFFTKEEIKKFTGKNFFTPNFEGEWKKLKIETWLK